MGAAKEVSNVSQSSGTTEAATAARGWQGQVPSGAGSACRPTQRLRLRERLRDDVL